MFHVLGSSTCQRWWDGSWWSASLLGIVGSRAEGTLCMELHTSHARHGPWLWRPPSARESLPCPGARGSPGPRLGAAAGVVFVRGTSCVSHGDRTRCSRAVMSQGGCRLCRTPQLGSSHTIARSSQGTQVHSRPETPAAQQWRTANSRKTWCAWGRSTGRWGCSTCACSCSGTGCVPAAPWGWACPAAAWHRPAPGPSSEGLSLQGWMRNDGQKGGTGLPAL